VLEKLIATIQKFVVLALASMLALVVVLSTVHLGALIAEEIWKPPRFLIPVEGLLEIFGYFLPVLIGVELLETLKAYVKKDVIHVCVAGCYNSNSNTLTDAKAKELIDGPIAIETAELELKKSYLPKLYAVLPAVKVARYIQIENKIRVIVKYQIAAEVPLTC